MKCPECRSGSILRVKRRRADRLLGHIVPIRPYRCQTCDHYFWARIRWRHQRSAYLGAAIFWGGLLLVVGVMSTALQPTPVEHIQGNSASLPIADAETADAADTSSAFAPPDTASSGDQAPAVEAASSIPVEAAQKPASPAKASAAAFYVTTDRVHLREGAGTQFRSITILERDRVLPAVEPTSGEWIQLRHYDRTGYVHRSLLKPAPPPDDEQQQS